MKYEEILEFLEIFLMIFGEELRITFRSSHREGGVLQNSYSTTILKTIEEYVRRTSIFNKVAGCRLTRIELLHRFFV